METKKEIRRNSLEKRKQLPEDIRREYSRIITKRVLCHPFFQCADTVLCYAAFREEVETDELILHSLKLGKTVGIPKVHGKMWMEFYEIHDLSELRPGYQGIREPVGSEMIQIAPENLSDKTPLSSASAPPVKMPLMILPGAVFDQSGNRIGYGGGFYDAYLQRYPHFYKIGLSFCVQCVEHIQAESHDICMDAVLTEHGDYLLGRTTQKKQPGK